METSPVLALNETRKTLLASRLRIAAEAKSPFVATIFPGDAVWLEKCKQVNTSGMAVPLDLLFLDADHRVVAKVVHLPPGAVSPIVPLASGVLELPAGTIPYTHTEIGDRILIEVVGGNREAS